MPKANGNRNANSYSDTHITNHWCPGPKDMMNGN